jgi:predicted Zn-dependent protease
MTSRNARAMPAAIAGEVFAYAERMRRFHAQCTAAAITFALALAACATNPVTGERQLALVSEGQEVAMGQSAAAEVRRSIGLVNDRSLQNYVAATGLPLAKASERATLPWSFEVVDDPTPNAFALPGGFIFVTRGLLNLMDSQAELAVVLGHEIGHVTARHAVTAMSRQQLTQLGLGLGTIFFPEVRPFGDVIGAGLGLLFLRHGRDAERQADELSIRYAGSQRFDVREGIDVFDALRRAGDEQRSALPAWLSTHPAPEERAAALRQQLKVVGALGSIVDRSEYLNQIDGLVYGSNPRQGFFRGQTFYHPDLRFQLTLPAGWQGQNLTHAVQAISPQRDAALVLTLSRAASANAAALQLAAQPGIRVFSTSSERIGGLPAVVSAFEAATEGGVVRGLVAHVAHRGRVYELLGYSPADRFGFSTRDIERAIASFAPVNDRAILSVQPRRVDVVRLPRAMSLAEFAQTYPSSIPIEELAVINQVQGPGSRLAAGTLVKRITGGN